MSTQRPSTKQRAPHPWIGQVAAALALAGALGVSGCGGSSETSEEGDGGGGGETTTSEAPATAAERPEGEWVMVEWLTAREGATQLGDATESRVKFTPTCDEGPCDIEVTPAGADGTYLPEGYPVTEGTTPSSTPFTLRWDEASGTYRIDRAARPSSCTVETGVIPDGYTLTTTGQYTFVPPSDGRPPGLQGTGEEVAVGTEVGLPAGCTNFTETIASAGAPVDADLSDTDLAGTYVVTEIVEATEPADQRPTGFRGVLFPDAAVEAKKESYTLKGLSDEPVALEESDGTWSGSGTSTSRRCSEGEGPGEFDSTETWSDLRPGAVPTPGGVVLSGTWELVENPNEAGVAAGCSFVSNKGWVILVPSSAVG